MKRELEWIKKKSAKPHSLQRTVLLLSAALLSVFIILNGVLLWRMYQTLLDDSYINLENTLEIYCSQLDEHLYDAELTMINYATSNADAIRLVTAKQTRGTYLTQVRVQELLSASLTNLNNIDGLFVFAPKTKIYVSKGKTAEDECNRWLKSFLRNGLETDLILNQKKWTFVNTGTEYYLIRAIYTEHSVLGAWCSLSNLLKPFQIREYDNSIIYYADMDGVPVLEDSYLKTAVESGNSNHTIMSISGERYLAITKKVSFGNYNIFVLKPLAEITASFTPLIRLMIIIFAILLIVLLIVLLSIIFIYRAPLTALAIASKCIEEGNIDNRNTESLAWVETQQINRGIDTLIQQVKDLRINIYEEQLDKQGIELQYLKSQIAPHFMVNCFRTLQSMQEAGESSDTINKVISSLADHLRYTLRPSDKVALSEEIHFVKNYISFTELRFPGFLKLETMIDSDAELATIFPMLILMLTENSIKYNMTMGELLTITISCLMEGTGQNRLVHIIHIDDGYGYPPGTLEQLNSLQDHSQNPTITGHRIGLYNIVRRMQLMYGSNGSIRFSNEEGKGARIDITIPFLPFDSGASTE